MKIKIKMNMKMKILISYQYVLLKRGQCLTKGNSKGKML